jgi:hypothetical protein
VSGLKPSAKITIECSKILQIPAKKKLVSTHIISNIIRVKCPKPENHFS